MSRRTTLFQSLYPEPTPSETYHNRLAQLAEEADRKRLRTRPLRRATLGLALATGALLAALSAPRVAQAVRLIDAARLLESGKGIVIQEHHPNSLGVLARTQTTWATRDVQRREADGRISLWKAGRTYSWSPPEKTLQVRNSDPLLGGTTAQFLRGLAWETCLDLVRREHRVQLDSVVANGHSLNRLTLLGEKEKTVLYFDRASSVPVQLDVVAPGGTLVQRDTLSVEAIPTELLTLPENAPILDLDRTQDTLQKELTQKPQHTLEHLTVYDVAEGAQGDLYLLYAEPTASPEPGMMTLAASFQFGTRTKPSYTLLETKLSQRPDGLRLAVFTPLQSGATRRTSLTVTVRLPDSYAPFPLSSGQPPHFHDKALTLTVRALKETAPEYAPLPIFGWRADAPSLALRRAGARNEAAFWAAQERQDWQGALALTEKLLQPGSRLLPADVWLQRSVLLKKLGRATEAAAAARQWEAEKRR